MDHQYVNQVAEKLVLDKRFKSEYFNKTQDSSRREIIRRFCKDYWFRRPIIDEANWLNKHFNEVWLLPAAIPWTPETTEQKQYYAEQVAKTEPKKPGDLVRKKTIDRGIELLRQDEIFKTKFLKVSIGFDRRDAMRRRIRELDPSLPYGVLSQMEGEILELFFHHLFGDQRAFAVEPQHTLEELKQELAEVGWSLPVNLTPPKGEIMAAKLFERRAFVHGRPAEEYSDDTLYQTIAQAEAEIENLKKLKSQPKKLKAKIADIENQIDDLTAYIDERVTPC